MHEEPLTSQSVDWYSEGESRIIRIGEIEVRIRFVGRKGRRGRIVVEAPAGAVFINSNSQFQRYPSEYPAEEIPDGT